MRIVYESYSEPEAILVKSLLEEEGIETWFYDHRGSEALPHLDFTEEYCLTVTDSQADQAEVIVKGFQKTTE